MSRASIIVAAHVRDTERLPDLQSWFHALCNQSLPADDYEVIVVDGSYEADYDLALARFRAEKEVRAQISCHRIECAGRARALNYALEYATGELIIFLADDCLPSAGFAEAHVHFHEEHPEPAAVGISSAMLPPEYRNAFSVWLEQSGELFGVPFRADMVAVPDDFFYVANASVKRELLERAGRFDERFVHHAFDDVEFGFRLRAAGMRSRFIPEACVSHVHDINLRGRERAVREAGAAAKTYFSNHPEKKRWLWLPTWPCWFHRWRVASAGIWLAAAGTVRAQSTWWRARLDAAFAEGYHKGV